LRLNQRWHPRHLLLAPHRLAFFLAMVLLAASGGWWAWVQGRRLVEVSLDAGAVPVPLVHAALMVLGFFPLFFSGFLFTAGPKWLRVQPWPVRRLGAPLLLLAIGWLVWLAGAQRSLSVAQAGAWLALTGMAWVTALFWTLLRRSEADDQVHPRVVGVAFLVGTACVAGLAIGVALGDWGLARRFVLSGLWGFAVLVFVTVAHRMLPFFSPPGPHDGHPWGALALLVGAAGFEAVAVWADAVLPAGAWAAQVWTLLQGALELAVGGVLLWRAWGWAKRQSLRNRLLRMFYLGFVWLGLAFVLHGLARGAASAGEPQWQLGALHALTMGCLATLMLAMVTRVSCGNSGRSQVADQVLWALFNLLQLATLLRVAAALGGAASPALLALAALLWATISVVWALRLGSWYGRPRPDGRAG
jgi:uncharacterized protein involved in response to NO